MLADFMRWEVEWIKSKGHISFLTKNRQELIQIFSSVLGEITINTKQLDYKFNHDLTDNVLLNGLKLQTKKILENIKCKSTTKFSA